MMCDSTERTVPMNICRVCGDRAIGFNFNVLACGSCKLFFLRNALQHKVLNFCQFANNCIVSKSTRKSCPSCRLAKCFKVEMKKEFISKRHNSLSIIQINKNSTDLKGHEIVQLSQLKTAGSAYCEENSFPEKGEAANLLQVANLDGYSVVRTIQFCKSLPGFKELQVNDQLILLKHFCAEKGFVRGAFYCDLKRDGFPLTDV